MNGKELDLSSNNEILKIKFPQSNVGGPYAVVYKDLTERWAVVAMDWNGQPRLGIRWFNGNGGNPFSSGHPTWFVIPSELSKSTLDGLTIDYQLRVKIEEFLLGKIKGDELV